VKKLSALFCIFVLLPSLAAAQSNIKKIDINEVSYFVSPPISRRNYYFSMLNPTYTVSKYKNYLYNGCLDIAKFLNLQIDSVTEEQSRGSLISMDQDITVTIDADIMMDFLRYVRPVKLVSTEYGDILTLTIARTHLNKVWKKYHNYPLPSFTFPIENELIDGYPSWFLSPPDSDEYIFGTGIYSANSTVHGNFKNADYIARVNVIQTIKIEVKSFTYDFLQDNFELYSFFNEQRSNATIGGIYIIKRYYDKTTKTAYSLAAFKK
jgi:hypothetical protein